MKPGATRPEAESERSTLQPVEVLPATNLPVVVPAKLSPTPPATPRRRRWPWLLLILAALGAAACFYWWQQAQNALPPGFVSANGRIEADEIDIETKFAGRIAELMVDEGDLVKAGQVLARMDTRDLEASLARAEDQVAQAQKALDEARANVVQQQAAVTLAKQQLGRASVLFRQSYATRELFDQRQQQMDAANAALTAAIARVGEAEHALQAALHTVEFDQVTIADNTLVAPRDGRVQYRLANVGEVLGAGGKVFTLLDIGYVYMDVFLPTADAGRAVLGGEARILLDALPDRPIPAKVSFIASQAQFTPKTVETRSERDKLMFRVRVRIDRDLLRAHAAEVRSGLPGVAYLRLDPAAAWPKDLQPRSAQ